MVKVSKAEKAALKAAKEAAKLAAKEAKKQLAAELNAAKAKVKEIKAYQKLVKKGKAEAKKPTIDLY